MTPTEKLQAIKEAFRECLSYVDVDDLAMQAIYLEWEEAIALIPSLIEEVRGVKEVNNATVPASHYELVSGDEINAYLRDGWILENTFPNPHPQPFFYALVKTDSGRPIHKGYTQGAYEAIAKHHNWQNWSEFLKPSTAYEIPY